MVVKHTPVVQTLLLWSRCHKNWDHMIVMFVILQVNKLIDVASMSVPFLWDHDWSLFDCCCTGKLAALMPT
jgi:hypothetical protein